MVAIDWDTVSNVASAMGIADVGLKYIGLVVGGAYLVAYKDGFELVCSPMKRSKVLLEDVKEMLDNLDEEDIQLIMQCCESSDMSLEDLRTEYKNSYRAFQATKFERMKCWKATLWAEKVTSWHMRHEAKLALIERRIERLHLDTMTTTTRASAIKKGEQQRSAPSDAEAAIEPSDIKTSAVRLQESSNISLSDRIGGSETVRAVVLFNQ